MYRKSPKVTPPIIPPVMYIGSILHENDEFRKNKGKCHEENANAVIRKISLGFNFPRSSIPKSHPLKNPSSVANANMSVYRKR